MRLTHESPRARWLIMLGAWVLVACLAAWDTVAMRDYVGMLDSVGRRSPAVETPLRRLMQTNFMDAQMWTRHALAIEEGAPAQVRFTDTDNAPFGREVHWNSGLAHLLVAAGWLEHARTGAPLPRATEDALAWFNLPLFLGCVVLFSAWVARRAGAGAGVLVAFGMIGSRDFYAGFAPNYVDHHGLLSAAVFGVVLGALFMGGGWCPPPPSRGSGATNPLAGDAGSLLPDSRSSARGAAVFSAVCGAVGMWISAATTIPALVIVGVAAVAAVWWGGRAAAAAGAEFDPNLWRRWGRVGAGASLVFYLLEYAPSHFGLRLETNHPLHALAWWGGGEMIALLGEWRVTAGVRGFSWRQSLLAVAALGAVPVVILVLGRRVFVAGDPFVGRLSATVGEGWSLVEAVRHFGWGQFYGHFGLEFAGIWPATFLLARRRQRREVLLGFVVGAAVVFVAMGCWKSRWWLSAGGPLVGVWLVVLALWLRPWGTRARWLAVAAVAAGCYLPEAIERAWTQQAETRQLKALALDFVQPLYRDIAAALRESQPQGDIVLLASPNASTGIGYYGRFKTLGTLYWENTAGLRAAAEIFSAPTDEAAFALLRARGVTHLALTSDNPYLAEYFDLLHPGVPADAITHTFGYRLFAQRQIPQWLRSIPYRAPADMLVPGLVVTLLQVAPEQTETEAWWNFALSHLALKEFTMAEKNFTVGINLAPLAERPALCAKAGNLCYTAGAPAAAARFYRTALEAGENSGIRCNLIWILATSKDDAVRNGSEALATAEQIARQYPEDHVIANILAAALAENGRFVEAATMAERAVALARAAGDKSAEMVITQRLAAYRAGRPWRQ